MVYTLLMKASVLDLRYNMKKVLEALARREVIHLYHRRKRKGTIHPFSEEINIAVKEHPYFGCSKTKANSVDKLMSQLRGVRFSK